MRFLYFLYEELFLCLWLLLWVAGVVIAKGFWSTLFAVCTGGFWSAYLVVERILTVLGLI